jgi:hypothetical protein
MLSSLEIALLLAVSAGFFLLYKIASGNGSAYRRPPGPKGYPIIGNLFDMPSGNEVFVWAEWRQKWGTCIFRVSLSTAQLMLRT